MNAISPKFYTGNIESGLVNKSLMNFSLYTLFFNSYCLKSLGKMSLPFLGSKNSSTNSFYLINPKVTSSWLVSAD